MVELDKQAPVTMQELLVSTFAQGDALAKLLIEKGLIGEKKYLERGSHRSEACINESKRE